MFIVCVIADHAAIDLLDESVSVHKIVMIGVVCDCRPPHDIKSVNTGECAHAGNEYERLVSDLG